MSEPMTGIVTGRMQAMRNRRVQGRAVMAGIITALNTPAETPEETDEQVKTKKAVTRSKPKEKEE
jgi:hypothetical protein